jgi:glycosyltransferase involved in cell wall biosynthesis
LPRRLRDQLRRGQLPEVVDASRIQRVQTATGLALATLEQARLLPRLMPFYWRHHFDRFDSTVSARVRTGDAAAVVLSGVALATMRAAHRANVPVLYWYPTAHHDFAAAILREEALRKPAWARTLTYRFSPQHRQRLDAEISEADMIACLSTFQKRTFAENGVDTERLALLPLGVDHELFRPLDRPRRHEFTVAFIGLLSQRKGLSYVLEAFDAAQLPDAQLLLVGRVVGSDRPWRNHPRVRHVPQVLRWRLPELYAQADVFVLPSLVEGFAQTALEAMACGLPVIVSEHTFGTGVVSDGEDGFVVPIRDPDAIADRLRLLHSDPDLRQAMGVRARATAERFGWSEFGQRALRVIDALAGSRRTGAAPEPRVEAERS